VRVAVPGARLWSTEAPNLYEARISLKKGAQIFDQVSQTFGFREIKTNGTHILLNGKPVYLRGYGDDSSEVLTGAPPHSKDIYLERMRIAKGLGSMPVVPFHDAVESV